MAGALKTLPIRRPALLLALAMAPWLVYAAEEWPDPMRPALAAPTPPASAGSGQGEAASAAQQLQSVILRRGQRPAAIINGQVVELGDDVAGARVTAIKESEVVLQGPAGREVLKLTPEVNKQPVVDTYAASKTSKARNSRGNGDRAR